MLTKGSQRGFLVDRYPSTHATLAEFEGSPSFTIKSSRDSLDGLNVGNVNVALELRPNCECCDKDLPPESTVARICTYECTFCADCVENELFNVCPNCGGGFAPRPIRPATEWRPGLSVAKRPPSTKRRFLSYSREEIEAHSRRIMHIRPENR
jgi:uncharacterized protein